MIINFGASFSLSGVFDSFCQSHGGNAVKISYRRIFAALRDQLFYSLEEINEAIRNLLEEHNKAPFQRIKTSRRQLFNEIEKSALKPLPLRGYELKEY